MGLKTTTVRCRAASPNRCYGRAPCQAFPLSARCEGRLSTFGLHERCRSCCVPAPDRRVLTASRMGQYTADARADTFSSGENSRTQDGTARDDTMGHGSEAPPPIPNGLRPSWAPRAPRVHTRAIAGFCRAHRHSGCLPGGSSLRSKMPYLAAGIIKRPPACLISKQSCVLLRYNTCYRSKSDHIIEVRYSPVLPRGVVKLAEVRRRCTSPATEGACEA